MPLSRAKLVFKPEKTKKKIKTKLPPSHFGPKHWRCDISLPVPTDIMAAEASQLVCWGCQASNPFPLPKLSRLIHMDLSKRLTRNMAFIYSVHKANTVGNARKGVEARG